jgi:hypothetical protein
MKNGTPSRSLKLVDSAGHTISDGGDVFDPVVDDERRIAEMGQSDLATRESPANSVLIFVAVSVACAVAAIAAGSYAIWLTRQKVAHETISNVQDILKICQERMHQLEDDLNLLPPGLSSPT